MIFTLNSSSFISVHFSSSIFFKVRNSPLCEPSRT
jgi:hypothetical protein